MSQSDVGLAVRSFAPSVAPGCRVLVLGSMPGRRSLDEQRYYAHPQNCFWPIMAELVGMERQADYAERLLQLHFHRLGLWDVLGRCEREGSLDSAIRRDSEQANPIEELLRSQSTIAAIAFNGATARQAFDRHLRHACAHAQREGLVLLNMPSTSPAHASMPYPTKLAAWQRILEYL